MAEQRLAQAEACVLLARGHDHGRVRLERAVKHADRIAEAGRDMEIDDARAAAGDNFRRHTGVVQRRHDIFEPCRFRGRRGLPLSIIFNVLNVPVVSLHAREP